MGRVFLPLAELTELVASLWRRDAPAKWGGRSLLPAVLFVTGDMALSYLATVLEPEGYTTTFVIYTNISYAVRLGFGLAFVAFFVRARDGSPDGFGLVRKTAREDFRWGLRAVTTGGVLFAIAALAVVAAIGRHGQGRALLAELG